MGNVPAPCGPEEDDADDNAMRMRNTYRQAIVPAGGLSSAPWTNSAPISAYGLRRVPWVDDVGQVSACEGFGLILFGFVSSRGRC